MSMNENCLCVLVVTKTVKVSVSGVGLGLDPAGLGLGLGLGLPGFDNISGFDAQGFSNRCLVLENGLVESFQQTINRKSLTDRVSPLSLVQFGLGTTQ